MAHAAAVVLFACGAIVNAFAAPLDLDGNLFGDVWELLYETAGLAPGGDADKDGATNEFESRASTNPFDLKSKLAITRVVTAAGGLEFAWPSILGKRYLLQRNGSLAPNQWVDAAPAVSGTGAEITRIVAPVPGAATGFYRLLVDDEDADGDGLTDWEERVLGFNPNNRQTVAGQDDLTVVTARLRATTNTIRVAASDAAASEVGLDRGSFEITRTGKLNAVVVNFTLSGTAVEGSDYQSLTRSVRLGVGVDRATVTVTPRSDAEVEPAESVILTLTPNAAYTIAGTPSATVSIADVPPPPAGQRTYFVKPDGTNAVDGMRRETAFLTLQHAADVVTAGDTVIVLPGVYTESVQLTHGGTTDRPITFKADAVARGRVTLSGARRDVRDNTVAWTLETSLGVSNVYSIPMSYTPIRVLSDDIDLYAYQSLDEFKQLWVNNVAGSNLPGPGPRHGWNVTGGKLYVRLHPSGQYGSVNPAQHVMKIGPKIGGTFFGNVVEKPSDYNFAVLTTGESNVVIDGFTFETPGLCGVYAPKSRVTVRNSWSIGCRALVAGTAATAYDDNCADTLVEYCEHTEQGVMQDVREVVEIGQALSPEVQATLHSLYWWHRKSGPLTYEYGLVAGAGTRWKLQHNFVHDTFDALSFISVSWSRDLDASYNILANLVDNAVETEEHAQGQRIHHNYLRDVWEPFSFQPTQNVDLPNDVEVHHNVSFMSAPQAAFWERLLSRQVAGCFKLFSPGLNQVSLSGNGFRYHHNTFWHPVGATYDTANLGDFMNNFAFEDNIVVARTLDIRRPDPPMPNFHFARNFVAPIDATFRGAGARFAGTGGAALATPAAIGLRDPANGDLSLIAGSPAATGGLGGGAAGAIALGENWTPPVAGPRTNPLAELGPTGAAPIARADTATVARGGRVKVFVLANDSDADRDLLTVLSITQGSRGRTELEGQQIFYEPGLSFSDTDQFSYTIGDGRGNSATASVTVTRINAAPIANADTVQAAPGATVTANVLSNDTDADGDTLSILSFTQGAKGTVTKVGTSLRYVPAGMAAGVDTFTYVASDGHGGTATGTVTIVALPNPPVALADTATAQGITRLPIYVLSNDNDGNGGTSPVKIEDATHGAKGKVDIRPGNPEFPRYEPYPGSSGTDTFTYTISNQSGQRKTTTVTVTYSSP